MRPRFSVENVGIAAGGNAVAVDARLPVWPPTSIPTSKAITAVRSTAVPVRFVMVFSTIHSRIPLVRPAFGRTFYYCPGGVVGSDPALSADPFGSVTLTIRPTGAPFLTA